MFVTCSCPRMRASPVCLRLSCCPPCWMMSSSTVAYVVELRAQAVPNSCYSTVAASSFLTRFVLLRKIAMPSSNRMLNRAKTQWWLSSQVPSSGVQDGWRIAIREMFCFVLFCASRFSELNKNQTLQMKCREVNRRHSGTSNAIKRGVLCS
jgi:hypothetical protein